jgi:ESCRT-II complex subunit VPS36
LQSFCLDLSSLAKTQHYAGLFTSSPKVTIYLTPEAPAIADGHEIDASWQCEVCDFRNPPGASPTGAKCALCGVPRPKAPSAMATPPRAASAPPPSTHLSPSPSTPPTKEIACSACTFLNNPTLTECEICGTALPQIAPILSRPETPKLEGAGDDSTLVRLSFRRGGDKALYAALKRSVLGRAWQVGAYSWKHAARWLIFEPPRQKQLAREPLHRPRNVLASVSSSMA